MRVARVFLAFLTASLLSTAARPQTASPTGNVYGTVLNELGTPIPRAGVALVGPGIARTTTTDAHGDFRFLNVAPGLHALALEREGFRSVRREVAVQVGKNVVVDVTMTVAEAQESVTVLGGALRPDSRKVQTGQIFDARYLREVPTTRDIYAILRQVPGVLLSDMNVGGTGFTLRPIEFVGKGARGGQNIFNLDGATVSLGGFSASFFDFDSLASVAVVTGGSDPSIASPGVTVNMVTKRGTNVLEGSARVLYTDGGPWEYGFEVGGPVWKDHVWLWGAWANPTFDSQTFLLPGGEPVRSRETNQMWNAKLTAQPAAQNSLTLAYSRFHRIVDGRGAAPDVSQPSTYDVDLQGMTYRMEDSHVLSKELSWTLGYSYVPNRRDAVAKGGLDRQAYLDSDYVWRKSNAWSFIDRTHHQAGLTVSAFFAAGEVRHELELGVGYRHSENQETGGWPADQLVGLAYPDGSRALVTRVQDARYLDEFVDAHLSDTFRIGDLTIQLGARFDYQRSRNLASSVGANPVFPDLLPAVEFSGGDGYPLSWSALQPRLSATYAIGADRKTLLRASYARFADQLGHEVFAIGPFPGIASLDFPWNDVNQNGIVEAPEVDVNFDDLNWENVNPWNPGSTDSVNEIAPGTEPPETNEFTIGIEREIESHLSAAFTYTYRRLRGPLFSPLIATTRASYVYEGNAQGTIADPTTGFVLDFSEPYYGLTTDPPPNGSILENRPDTTETYHGLELRLEKTFSNGWLLTVGAAYHNWRQEIGRAGIVNPNNEVPGTNASGPVVVGDIDAMWQFNVGGSATLPFGIRAGANFFGRQGFPILYFVEAVTNDTQGNRPALQIGSAATYRTPNVYQLDLELSRDFLVVSTVRVSPVASCFNVLDSHTVLAREGRVGTFDAQGSPAFIPNGSFNAVAERLGGRAYRMGVRISF